MVYLAAFTCKELESMIDVGIGDFKTAIGDKKLMTRDLGSCVAIALRDSTNNVGGLLHIMLPKAPNPQNGEKINLAKYADTGIDEMIKTMMRQGAKKEHMCAKIMGAAHMVKTENVPEERDISSRNLMAVKRKLAGVNIPVLASSVGGHHPRTVVFDIQTGGIRIVTSGMADRYI
jgi:chemotaxis protein CheD